MSGIVPADSLHSSQHIESLDREIVEDVDEDPVFRQLAVLLAVEIDNAHLGRARPLGHAKVSAIETLQSGLPFTPQLSYNPSNDGDTRNPVRPSLNPNFSGNIIEGSPNQYFNPYAFIQPLPGTYGNVPRNTLPGPSLVETDLSAAKKFSLSERLRLQFRAEIFNLLNHTNFNTPNPVVYASATGGPSPTAGVITSTSTSSRQVQFGLKLIW